MKITSRNNVITSVNDSTEPTNLQYLDLSDQTVHYLPKEINKFFPNLKGLEVRHSKLMSLAQDDFKFLTQLEIVIFYANDLETLNGDLFEFNTNLTFVNFGLNELKYVDENLLDNLKDLKQSYFGKNPCIDANAQSSSEIPALIVKLKSQCNLPSEVRHKINQLEEETVDLKTKNSKKENELNTKSSQINSLSAKTARQADLIKDHEIQHGKDENSIKQLNAEIGEMKNELNQQAKVVASLQNENSKLKRWLKSCDGNLDSATEILFKMGDHQQVFIQPPSEPLDLIVEIDGFRVTASKLIIGLPGLMVNSVKNVKGSDVNIDATELQIDHQQTLFLPTNLGQHFPSLQVLAVKSSGLMLIDSCVFSFLTNLKKLNLTSNKLQEIEPDTFDQLRLLESLDLSSNNLKTLKASAINGLEQLQFLYLAGNQLKSIPSNIFKPLKVLQTVDLSKNDCINMSSTKVALKAIEDQLIKDCIVPVEVECSTLGPDHSEVDEEEFDCIAVNLTIIHPKTRIAKFKNEIDFDVFILSVVDQHIAFLPFQLNKTFTDLHVLVVIRSNLTALNQRDFEGLTNLKNITIVNNNISLIERGVFDDVPQLEHLNLSSNHIETLPEMIFAKLVQLKTLDLSDNQLQSFVSELLPLNHVIEEFHFKNNKLQKIYSAMTSDLKNAKIIDLTDNVCIDFKYGNGKALTELSQALQKCQI